MTDSIIVEKKQYLKRYKKNLANIERLKNKIAILDDRIYGLKSPTISDMPRGGTPITNEDLIAKKDGILRRIKRLEAKSEKLREEILEKIDEIDDPRYAEVLESFFIDCKDMETIAEENCYSIRHIYTLYNEAVKAIRLSYISVKDQ